jgi:hypothetical protein
MKAIDLLSCFTCTTSKGKVDWSEIDTSKCQRRFFLQGQSNTVVLNRGAAAH